MKLLQCLAAAVLALAALCVAPPATRADDAPTQTFTLTHRLPSEVVRILTSPQKQQVLNPFTRSRLRRAAQSVPGWVVDNNRQAEGMNLLWSIDTSSVLPAQGIQSLSLDDTAKALTVRAPAPALAAFGEMLRLLDNPERAVRVDVRVIRYRFDGSAKGGLQAEVLATYSGQTTTDTPLTISAVGGERLLSVSLLPHTYREKFWLAASWSSRPLNGSAPKGATPFGAENYNDVKSGVRIRLHQDSELEGKEIEDWVDKGLTPQRLRLPSSVYIVEITPTLLPDANAGHSKEGLQKEATKPALF